MFRGIAAAAFGFLVALASSHTASACGVATNCEVGDRHYRIHMPAGHDGETPVGAIIFAHGYRGTAAGVMRSGDLRALADRIGVALIAVKSAEEDWSIPHAPSDGTSENVDELAYFDALRQDVAQRFPIDAANLLVTGFSAGGMMTWTLACRRSADYAAFAPMAGTFWRPIPQTCEGPVANIIHIHGDDDKIVPLEGREVQDARQGAIRDAMKMYAEFGGFEPASPRSFEALKCEDQRSDDQKLLRFCLFEGGHSFSADFVAAAWEMFAQEGVLK